MSSPPSEPENAAPTSPVRSEQGQENFPHSGQNKPTRWTQTSRTSSTSLLTQALAGHQEPAENFTSSNASQHSPEPSITPLPQYFGGADGQSNNGVNTVEDKGGNMATVATGHIHGSRMSGDFRSAPSTPSMSSIHRDMEHVDSRLANYRDFLNGNRGRGISLERTEKEKRVQDSPKGTYSTNPGDTALPPSPVPVSPTALDTISNNHPTEGVRARYRSWREPRSGVGTGPEKAWSIGEDGADDILGGQVEKSIKDAMAGVEPNNRSRKASHSLRFFKEGLPDDKPKKRESKSRGRSKEGSALAKTSPISEHPKLRILQGKSDSIASYERGADGRSPASSPHGSNTPISKLTSTQARFSPISTLDSLASAGEGYFDSAHTTDTLSEEQVNTLPAALLDEIRKHHNLTPGAAKGSSFSRSIPVTESERPKPIDGIQTLKSVEDDQQHYGSDSDGDKPSHARSSEEDEESGEEQISSALFVPHKTPHDSPERERDGMRSVKSPVLDNQDRSEASTSQEWLEEYEVPSRDLDKKFISQESRPRPSLSPTQAKQPSLHTETEQTSSEPQALSDFDHGMVSEGGYSTAGEESSVADDQELTPTGSVKQDVASVYAPHIHDHQQVPRQPLEAIELIPYRHQVGGHTTMWRFSKRAVCKQLNNRENEFYEKVEHYHPQLLKFLPRYIGVLNVTLEKQIRRKPTRKDLAADAANETQVAAKGSDAGGSTDRATLENGNSISASTEVEQGRVISQSLSSGSVPIPTVTFADNRHIIPKSFMQPRPHSVDLHNRSISDSASPANLRSGASLSNSPMANGDVKYRPTLSDKHAVSWGATTVNKQLRNQVFNEAFLDQPIPIQAHKKPASQKRPLPARHGPSHLRTSNSESSLKAAQQSQLAPATQPTEPSIRKKAMRAAAEQRNGLTPLTSTEPASTFDESGPNDEEEEKIFGGKAGTSAPEPDIIRPVKGKRQRRYSSGGLRRKPGEVQDDRGNLKYFEEADDVGYKGDMEEDLFSMDPELSKGAASLATSADREGPIQMWEDGESVVGSESSIVIGQGTMLPAGPSEPPEPSNLLDIHRPVNPKEAQTQRDSRVEYFLLLEDLTAGMKRPCIMDLKMGTRQYGVNADEKKQKSQRRKCSDTTSKELGVRVCGLQVWDVKQQEYIFLDKYFGRDLKVGRPFQDALKRFLYDGVDYSSVLRHIPTILKKLAQLELIIQGLAGYRFYAASLLLFYDGDTKGDYESDSATTGRDMGARNEIDFKIADFANCITKEDARPDEWQAPPQHPELPDNGFLRGLRSLRRYFLAIQRECKAEVGLERQNFTTMVDNTDEEDGIMSY